MNVARQRRKISHLVDEKTAAGDAAAAAYLTYLLVLFDAEVAQGTHSLH
jgi:hypothetical protein